MIRFPINMAIVGNGCNCIGRWKGREIDAFENVCRMNDWHPVPRTFGDYGQRRNVMVHCIKPGVNKPYWDGKIDFIYVPLPEDGWGDRITMVPQSKRHLVRWANREVFDHLWRELGSFPSTGITFLEDIHRENGLEGCKIYGFDFFQSAFGHGNYYEAYDYHTHSHNTEAERNYFRINFKSHLA